uniref:Uncharacterized protein n=1 Tax=Anguilla anguilla TaxID=7936 RepID=A0A0E9SZA5_ANGAN
MDLVPQKLGFRSLGLISETVLLASECFV